MCFPNPLPGCPGCLRRHRPAIAGNNVRWPSEGLHSRRHRLALTRFPRAPIELLVFPEIGLELRRFIGKQRADDFSRTLPSFENDRAGEVECGILDVCTRQPFDVMFALPKDDPSDARPIDCSGAHRARFGRSVECAGGQLFETEIHPRPRGQQPFGMSGAVAPSGFVTVELLAQHIAVFVSEERTKGMFASIAGPARDFERLTEQALIIGALWHRQILRQCGLIIVPNNPPTQVSGFGSAMRG
ncbi:hypothetical protein BQ8482_250068 [Mesorhizobium delmotii]|uniref:Uncharacterized protein n=1 Tax=Mesorhizobium delmotii TaxID=1631247 RepID=A0A2P9AM12_9HYPH|nr:hypothetical protein BQ8482_250068 [Mesorhizobium delmotii]